MRIKPVLAAFFALKRDVGEQQDIVAADTYAALVTNNFVHTPFGSTEWFTEYVAVVRHAAIALDESDDDYRIAVMVANATIQTNQPYLPAAVLDSHRSSMFVARLRLGAQAIIEQLEAEIPSLRIKV